MRNHVVWVRVVGGGAIRASVNMTDITPIFVDEKTVRNPVGWGGCVGGGGIQGKGHSRTCTLIDLKEIHTVYFSHNAQKNI